MASLLFGFGGGGTDEQRGYSERDGVAVVLGNRSGGKISTGTSTSASSGGAARSFVDNTAAGHYHAGHYAGYKDGGLGSEWLGYDGPDLTALALETYTLALVTAPLVVLETLQETQTHYPPQPAGGGSELDAYVSVGAGGGGAAEGEAEQEAVPALVSSQGVWGNVRLLGASRGVGLGGLARGHLTSFVVQFLARVATPAVEEALNDALDVVDDHHPATALAAALAVGAVLSPLELIRTRLIVQSVASPRRRYYGAIHAAAATHAAEGPHRLSPLYAAPALVPALVCTALASAARSLARSAIERDLGLSPEYAPLRHTAAVLVFLLAEVLVVTPFELARKRLQVQSLKPVNSANPGDPIHPFTPIVNLAQVRYKGIFDVIRHVVTHEYLSSTSPSVSKKSAPPPPPIDAAPILPPENDAFDEYGSWSKKSSDWQDLYASPSQKPAALASSLNNRQPQKVKYWDGVRSLYRAFWTRYSIRVVEFAFESMRDVGDNAWDI
ncbi:hypothetical protein HK100_009307 [Physocladia obscura]|uniref:Mitochondrial carrier n=1 Tax=Physocladia obscura TaxID=109957 RepID=A0AAD5SNN4_9FUNG|nr:hypothetical protein HK100_009307 [Physocladia obscura]